MPTGQGLKAFLQGKLRLLPEHGAALEQIDGPLLCIRNKILAFLPLPHFFDVSSAVSAHGLPP